MNDKFSVAQVGQKVCILTRGHHTEGHPITRSEIGEIERVTPTQIVAFGRRFLRSSGAEYGRRSSYRTPHLTPLTPEIEVEIQRSIALFDAQRAFMQLSDYFRMRTRFGLSELPGAVATLALIPNEIRQAAEEYAGRTR